MFLQCGQYGKKASNKHKFFNSVDQHSFTNPDEFAFSDFFIRKHPKAIQFNHEIQKNQRQTDKQQNHFLIQKDDSKLTKQKNEKNMTIFGLPNKAAFQIKFLHHKNRKNSQLNSAFHQQSSQKFKDKRELIRQRKIKNSPTYTPRSSNRYSHSSNIDEQNFFEFRHKEKEVKRKSIQISSNLIELPNNLLKGEMKQDFRQFSFINAYKVKSLVLGKNPKEQFASKSKKFMKSLFEKKKSSKKIHSYQIDTKKPSDKNSGSLPQTSRIITQYRNKNAKHIRLRSSGQQNSKKSAKLNSIFQNTSDAFRLQEIFLEPWTKTNEIDNFQDNLHQIVIDSTEQINEVEFNNAEIHNIDLKPPETRIIFRKLYCQREKKQEVRLKETISSQK